MKIAILAAKDGFSFVNQASALAEGFRRIGVDQLTLRIDDFPAQKLSRFRPDVVIGVGSWHSYDDFVVQPSRMGYCCVPWIVSDDAMTKHVEAYNRLPLFLTTSPYCRTVFIRDGIQPERLAVVPEAVDDRYWRPLSWPTLKPFVEMISIRQPGIKVPYSYDLIDIKLKKIPILFTTGGDATSKGAQETIAALGRLDKKIPWLYLIKTWPSAGSFERSIEELNLAKKFGILDRIHYIVGQYSQDFMLSLMNLCDIYVAPSRSEGFGLPHVEAQMCAKPVITVDGTATKETIIHGQTGYLAKARPFGNRVKADVGDLAKHLRTLLTSPTRRKRFGQQGRIQARRRFSPEVVARQMIQVVSQREWKNLRLSSTKYGQ
jgi:glycosyltransferase involved in cell wall biosynthesis